MIYSTGTPANAGGGKGRGTKAGVEGGTSGSIGTRAEESIESPGDVPRLSSKGVLMSGLLYRSDVLRLLSSNIYSRGWPAEISR
jgi:hypothetical protein